MFASRSVPVHLARGALAIAVLVLAFVLVARGVGWLTLPLAGGLGVGALVLLRGCPMCWLVGLMETIGASKRP